MLSSHPRERTYGAQHNACIDVLGMLVPQKRIYHSRERKVGRLQCDARIGR